MKIYSFKFCIEQQAQYASQGYQQQEFVAYP